ncbi:MAG: TetR/AcrR family transcriptional regulator, partial [Phycicoccus sp.]
MPRGRPRSETSRRAILDAAVELLETDGWSALTVERLANRAGVGKQTIYRWYGGDLGRVVVEAYVDVSDTRGPAPDTGSVREDLLAVVVPVARMNRDRERGLPLANRSLMA